MKIIVYTCIVNNYDSLHPIPLNIQNENVRFVCFSDDTSLNADGWEVFSLSSPETLKNPALINRYHKFFPDKVLPECDWSIYIDGNISFNTPPHLLMTESIINKEIACFEHPVRNYLDQEVDAIIRHKKIPESKRSEAEAQVQYYYDAGLPAQMKLLTNFIIFRRFNSEKLKPAMEDWWIEFNNNIKRDQLSLNYVLWKNHIEVVVIEMDNNNDERIFSRLKHQKKGFKGLRRKVKRSLKNFFNGRS